MAIPNKLMISALLVEDSELAEIIEKFEFIFDGEQNEESDFNKLTLFLTYHKLIGQKSFYFPMLNVT